MMSRTISRSLVFAATASLVALASAHAQAWNYPSFQTPRTVAREFNFGVADGGKPGTSFDFQWREGVDPKNELGLDAGIASPSNNSGLDNVFFIGGRFEHQILESSPSSPLDLLFTGGINLAHANIKGNNGSFRLLRIPLGVSLGHRFPMQGGMAITPYIVPRAIWEDCHCGGANDSKVALNIELGTNLEFTPSLAGRVGIELDNSDFLNDDAFGISLAWHPLAH